MSQISALQKDYRFTNIQDCRRIWAIPSVHAQVDQLMCLHDLIYREFTPGDRLIYMGNYTGYNVGSIETQDEMLAFRRTLIAKQGVKAEDLIYLRGAQEEMMQKLLQIQFAPNPRLVIEWMLSHGLAQTLEAYSICIPTLLRTAGEGVIQLSKWTSHLREMIRKHAGHEELSAQYKRAAYQTCSKNTATNNAVNNTSTSITASIATDTTVDATFGDSANAQESAGITPILFVSAGIDFSKALEDQGDTLWWGAEKFSRNTSPYAPFQKVFRGYDPKRRGLHLNCVTATLDDNCGFDGRLICASIENDGSISNMYQA